MNVLQLASGTLVWLGLAAASVAASAADVDGVFRGQYVCQQGATGVTLSVATLDTGDVAGVFTFYALPGNKGVPTGSFDLKGRYDSARQHLSLQPDKWVAQPKNFVMVGVEADLKQDGDQLVGKVTGASSCSVVSMVRLGRGE